MSGHTGKMTKEAVRQRGPQMLLVRVYPQGYKMPSALLIFRQGKAPFSLANPKLNESRCRLLACSYSLSYLLRIGRANQEVA